MAIVVKQLLIILCYTLILMFLSVLIQSASSSSLWRLTQDSWLVQRLETARYSVLKMTSVSYSFLPSFQDQCEKGGRKIVRARNCGWLPQNSVSCTQQGVVHVNSRQLWQCAQDLGKLRSDKFHNGKGKWAWSPTWSCWIEWQAINGCWEKVSFL